MPRTYHTHEPPLGPPLSRAGIFFAKGTKVMRYVTVESFMRFVAVCLVATLLMLSTAYAAKMTVTWTATTLNTDGTPCTDLASYRIEWGSCVNGAYGVTQGSIIVKAPATSTPIYPTNLTLVCVRAFAINAAGVESTSSAMVAAQGPSALGKPVTFGKPVVLPKPH